MKALGEAAAVIYAGVAMGQLFKGSLRPDPALAFFCGLNREAVPLRSWTRRRRCVTCAGRRSPPGRFPKG